MPTRVIQIDRSRPDARKLAPAVKALREGKLVVFPTETVYGLGVAATDAAAVERLRDLKSRPSAPFSVHLARPDEVARYVRDVPPRARALMAKAWPGPVTLLLPTGGELAEAELNRGGMYERLTADGVIGLRCPDDEIARMLLERIDGPVLATSANLAGAAAPKTGAEAAAAMDGRADLVVDAGPTSHRGASTIVRFDGDRLTVVREGVFDEADIRRLSVRRVLFVCTGNTCRSPMAEAIARKLLADREKCRPAELPARGLEVASAGTFGGGGHPATPEAVAAAEALGASLADHRSRKLTNQLINSADVILCTARRHMAEVTRRAPLAAAKTMLLDASGDIEDPIGGDAALYRQVAGRIAGSLRARMKENVL